MDTADDVESAGLMCPAVLVFNDDHPDSELLHFIS